MNARAAWRIFADIFINPGPRQVYWNGRQFLGQVTALLNARNTAFLGDVSGDQIRFLRGGRVQVTGNTAARARAAADWLLRAQAATPDDGVSLGYFPCDGGAAAWRPSYPETTGYIISTLLKFAETFDDEVARGAALRMGRWEVEVQMPSGAVQGGPVTSPERQTAAAFNTGMVLDGWCTLLGKVADARVFEAARRAAAFLASDLDGDGFFRTNGAFVSAGELKTYTCLCAWHMHRFADLADDAPLRRAAVKATEAALRQQRQNGWFAHNCLSRSDAPLTHTICYTLQGILEVGILAAREDFIAAARRGADPLVAAVGASGFLHGRFYDDWTPAAFSSCLTGSAQLAVICYRLAAVLGEPRYADTANRLVDHLKGLQAIDARDRAVNGALAGSFPILGQYMRAGYPNWATKYFLDALMLQHERAAMTKAHGDGQVVHADV